MYLVYFNCEIQLFGRVCVCYQVVGVNTLTIAVFSSFFLQAANYTQPPVHLKYNFMYSHAISMVKITVLDQSCIIVVVITVME